MKELLEAELFVEPFPLMVLNNFYNDFELALIWQELMFYTAPNKLLAAENYGGVVGKTNAKALVLDDIYLDYSKTEEDGVNFRNISNILTVNRKLFDSDILKFLGFEDTFILEKFKKEFNNPNELYELIHWEKFE